MQWESAWFMPAANMWGLVEVVVHNLYALMFSMAILCIYVSTLYNRFTWKHLQMMTDEENTIQRQTKLCPVKWRDMWRNESWHARVYKRSIREPHEHARAVYVCHLSYTFQLRYYICGRKIRRVMMGTFFGEVQLVGGRAHALERWEQ